MLFFVALYPERPGGTDKSGREFGGRIILTCLSLYYLASAFWGHKKHRMVEAGRDLWCHPVQALKQGHLQLGAQDQVHWLQRWWEIHQDVRRYTKPTRADLCP